MYVIGIDPGPVVGIVRLSLNNQSHLTGVNALQVTPGVLELVLEALAAPWAVVAVERFVIGPRSARSAHSTEGETARNLVALVKDWADSLNYACHLRSAAEVKPWASDVRLAAAGLIAPTSGMRHARDAARHALFCAVRDCGLTDPLISKANARCPDCNVFHRFGPCSGARLIPRGRGA